MSNYVGMQARTDERVIIIVIHFGNGSQADFTGRKSYLIVGSMRLARRLFGPRNSYNYSCEYLQFLFIYIHLIGW